MRDIIGLVLGLYLTVALVVAGGGVYGFLTDSRPAIPVCASGGSPNWMVFVGVRALIWPKAWFDDQGKTNDVVDWLVVKYDPFDSACT